MTTYTINVTQEDIDQGARGTCSSCPIALAAKRVWPDLFPAIGACFLALDSGPDKKDGKLIFLPLVARDFVPLFDQDFPVLPFSFEVTV